MDYGIHGDKYMSELFVNKILSHTDASNEIVVPSGHKLVAPGHVIQVKRLVVNTISTTTSTSWQTHMSGQLDATPRVGSLIVVVAHGVCSRGSDTNWGGGLSLWLNSTNIAGAAGVGNTGSFADGRSGMIASGNGANFTTSGNHTIVANDISGGNPTFYLKFCEMPGNSTANYIGTGSTASTGTYHTDTTSMIIQEIAQ